MGRETVFVYGTLMKGMGNNCFMAGSRFLGAGETVEEYRMTAGHGIPYLSRDWGESPIQGELWTVDEATLAELDRLEGHPNWYRRREIWILPEGIRRDKDPKILGWQMVKAWVYFNDETVGPHEIEDGDFRRWFLEFHREGVY